jgi:preprotein translocase subunit Sec63
MENLLLFQTLSFTLLLVVIAHYTTKIRFLKDNKKGYNIFIDVLSHRINNDLLPILCYPSNQESDELKSLYKKRNVFVYVWWLNIIIMILLPLLFPNQFNFLKDYRP